MPVHPTSEVLKLPPPATVSSLRSAALQSLAQSPRSQQLSPVDWRTELSPSPRLWESPSPVSAYAAKAPKVAAGKSTGTGPSPRMQLRVPEAISGYRPGLQAVPSRQVPPTNSDEHELNAMLQLIGGKCAEKFTKARDAFRFIDKDKDGTISHDEVRFFFRSFNIEREKADRFSRLLDVDNTGRISLHLFIEHVWPYITPGCESAQPPQQMVTNNKQNSHELILGRDAQDVKLQQRLVGHGIPTQLREARLRLAQQLSFKYKTLTRAFLELDKDSDGHLSRQDMEGLFERNGVRPSIREEFFDFIDQDGSGTIDIKEFGALFDRDLDGLRLRI